MSLSETHAHIKSRIWKEIARSKIDLSKVDQKTVEELVEIVTEAALLEMDGELAKTLAAAQGPTVATEAVGGIDQSVFDDQKEDILWEGRPFLSLTLQYTITDERIRITEGLIGKARENIELVRIQDMDYSQSFSERLLNVGDISIRSHDASRPATVLNNITDPENVYEILRRAVLNARKKHGFTYREEM